MKTRVSKEKILSYALSGTIICADASYVPKSRFNHHMSTAHMMTYDHMFYTLLENETARIGKDNNIVNSFTIKLKEIPGTNFGMIFFLEENCDFLKIS